MNAAHVKAALSVPRAEREKDRAELEVARATDLAVECFDGTASQSGKVAYCYGENGKHVVTFWAHSWAEVVENARRWNGVTR